MDRAARGFPPLPRLDYGDAEGREPDLRLGRCTACTLACPAGWRSIPYQLTGPARQCQLCREVGNLLAGARRLQRESGEFNLLLDLLRLASRHVHRSLAGPPGHDGLEEFEILADLEPELEADPEPLVGGRGEVANHAREAGDEWVEPLARP